MNEEPRKSEPTLSTPDLSAQALFYHQRTKHHLSRYARRPAALDWATQPAPFRTFAGAARTDLPLLADSLTTRFADLAQPDAVAAQPFSVANLAVLLQLSLGLCAWKQYGGSRWALRCNPSSGNLHPMARTARVHRHSTAVTAASHRHPTVKTVRRSGYCRSVRLPG